MSSEISGASIDSAASHARPSSPEELRAMKAVAAKLDEARHRQDCPAFLETFHESAVCEFKPAGLRITARATIAEMFQRSAPVLAPSLASRRQLREWSNQNGLLREWSYPVRLSSGEELPTTQLEIIEFADGLKSILSYRLRMNALFSKLFVRALGENFSSLPGVERVSG